MSDPFLFAGRSDAGAVRGVADGLASRGLTLTVVASTGPLVTLGARRGERQCPLSAVREAIRYVKSGQAKGKVVINID